MRQGAYGNELHTGLGESSDGLQVDTTGSLGLESARDACYSGLKVGRCEVVQHDPLHITFCQHFFHFRCIARFDFDRQLSAGGTEVVVRATDRGTNASRRVDMIVLDQDHVEQAEAVVLSAAQQDSPFLKQAEIRSGLNIKSAN